MSFLKGTLGMIGGGMGAMALLNEGEGETFTSYPEQSRLKQLTESKEKDHEILWSTFVGEPEGNDYKSFLNASLSEKAQILKNRASDTDDVLWRSKEWMRISGNPKAKEDYIPSALEYANPFTKDLPSGNQMMSEDFR